MDSAATLDRASIARMQKILRDHSTSDRVMIRRASDRGTSNQVMIRRASDHVMIHR